MTDQKKTSFNARNIAKTISPKFCGDPYPASPDGASPAGVDRDGLEVVRAVRLRGEVALAAAFLVASAVAAESSETFSVAASVAAAA
jgi:hypothetical protein